MKKQKISLLLLLIILSTFFLSCVHAQEDTYQQLNRIWGLSLPKPEKLIFNRGEETLDSISASFSFDVLMLYTETGYEQILSLNEWSFLSEPQLVELSSVLLSYYDLHTSHATPKYRVDTLGELLKTSLEKGDAWLSRKDILQKGDWLIILAIPEQCVLQAYYLVP